LNALPFIWVHVHKEHPFLCSSWVSTQAEHPFSYFFFILLLKGEKSRDVK
jgi:hypothetical protein